ncbi:acyl-CoA N-acyltransferase [Gaertneriomyces semiglobifer]|nr:acyl-CoA N-acyltransferase [Gaertneriomyces semiglobifer]
MNESKIEKTKEDLEADESIVTPGVAQSNASQAKANSAESEAMQQKVEEIMKKVAKVNLLQQLTHNEQKSRKVAKDMDKYKFWKTQPVRRVDETVEENGPIEADKKPEEIRQEPYPIPSNFEWCLVDIEDAAQIKELYELLSLNYVEDDDAMFRFDYSADFLKWALQPPGWKKSWHIGVRVAANKKLVAFISGIPANLRIVDHHQLLVEINFLCVHKKLRSKRLAPVLIKEVTRRVNLEGIFQATYTAGVYLPTPVSTSRYYHRTLSPKKLIETGFSHLGRNMTMARSIRLYRVPETTSTPGLRPMKADDVPAVTELLNKYLQKFTMAPHMTEDEVRHWLLPIKNVIYSYAAEDPETKAITDFVAFYSLPSSVIGHPVHKHINAAYLFYYAPKGLGEDCKRLRTLMNDALVLAKKENFDVFNCLDLMQNSEFLDELKFGRGDGNLHYYLYNYRCQTMKPGDLGLVLL